jgi:hypothetical protein
MLTEKISDEKIVTALRSWQMGGNNTLCKNIEIDQNRDLFTLEKDGKPLTLGDSDYPEKEVIKELKTRILNLITEAKFKKINEKL